VFQARNLPNMEGVFGGKNDPYARLRWQRGNGTHGNVTEHIWHTTRTVEGGGSAPEWDDAFRISHVEADAAVFAALPGAPSLLVVEVFDKDVGADDLIGTASIQVSGALRRRTATGEWFTLNGPKTKVDTAIKISIEFLDAPPVGPPPAGRTTEEVTGDEKVNWYF
jgi:hypothetical protein